MLWQHELQVIETIFNQSAHIFSKDFFLSINNSHTSNMSYKMTQTIKYYNPRSKINTGGYLIGFFVFSFLFSSFLLVYGE